MHNKKEYVLHIRNLNQALNHRLVLKKVHRVIQLNQKSWIKLYIDVNTELRKKAKNNLEKYFLKLLNNTNFGKTVKNVRNHRHIKLITNKTRKKLVSEWNYHTTNFFSDDLLATEMKKSTNNHK